MKKTLVLDSCKKQLTIEDGCDQTKKTCLIISHYENIGPLIIAIKNACVEYCRGEGRSTYNENRNRMNYWDFIEFVPKEILEIIKSIY